MRIRLSLVAHVTYNITLLQHNSRSNHVRMMLSNTARKGNRETIFLEI